MMSEAFMMARYNGPKYLVAANLLTLCTALLVDACRRCGAEDACSGTGGSGPSLKLRLCHDSCDSPLLEPTPAEERRALQTDFVDHIFRSA